MQMAPITCLAFISLHNRPRAAGSPPSHPVDFCTKFLLTASPLILQNLIFHPFPTLTSGFLTTAQSAPAFPFSPFLPANHFKSTVFSFAPSSSTTTSALSAQLAGALTTMIFSTLALAIGPLRNDFAALLKEDLLSSGVRSSLFSTRGSPPCSELTKQNLRWTNAPLV